MSTYNAAFYWDILKTQILDPTPCSGAVSIIFGISSWGMPQFYGASKLSELIGIE